MPPTTRNRGRPKTVRQSTPESQQPYQPTSTRAIQSKLPKAAKTKTKSGSKSRLKPKSKRPQQTITQMPLLHQLYHPELYHTELEYEEPQQDLNVGDETLALRSPKRRKITETPSSKADLNKIIHVNARTASSPFTTYRNIHQKNGGSSAVKDIAAMPPPTTTPKRPIRKEIPSSQSPLDTPLFALSRRSSKRDNSRSPLTERSRNLQIPIAISPKKPGRLSTREVADSMETEDEDLDEDEDPPLDSQIDRRIMPEKKSLRRGRRDPEESDTSHIQIKRSFQGEWPMENAVMKQTGRSSSTSPSKATTRSLEESDAAPTKPANPSRHQRHNHSSHATSSTAPIIDQINLVNEPPPESITSSPPPQESDIHSLAARCLPSLVVETDSQFEAGWHTYQPPPTTSNPPPPPLQTSTRKEKDNQPSSSQLLQYIPSSQPSLASPPPPPAVHTSTENSDEDTVPTQPLPGQQTPPPRNPPHVPASQATTTASPTQPQCFTPHYHEDGPRILVPSSPPIAGFSSPVVGGRDQGANKNKDDEGGSGGKYDWDGGRRVRASQLLLPASFLRDSWFVGPDDIEDGGVEMGEGEWIEEDE